MRLSLHGRCQQMKNLSRRGSRPAIVDDVRHNSLLVFFTRVVVIKILFSGVTSDVFNLLNLAFRDTDFFFLTSSQQSFLRCGWWASSQATNQWEVSSLLLFSWCCWWCSCPSAFSCTTLHSVRVVDNYSRQVKWFCFLQFFRAFSKYYLKKASRFLSKTTLSCLVFVGPSVKAMNSTPLSSFSMEKPSYHSALVDYVSQNAWLAAPLRVYQRVKGLITQLTVLLQYFFFLSCQTSCFVGSFPIPSLTQFPRLFFQHCPWR